jgi:hypothetical protein
VFATTQQLKREPPTLVTVCIVGTMRVSRLELFVTYLGGAMVNDQVQIKLRQ